MKKSIKGFWNWARANSRLATLLVIGLVVALVIITFELLSPAQLARQKQVGETLQPFGIGLGALLSAAAALNVLDDWISRQKKQRETRKQWRDLFPSNRVSKDFKLIQSKDAPGVLYVLKNRKRHWIVDPSTLRWLGLSYADVETINGEEFNKLDRGDNIVIDS
ncbi:hypothetical protein HY441_00720 [Candidatus Microgenomates bacterium]|nr:hypothetical protein [Candidatus Microgenomates bacterium]